VAAGKTAIHKTPKGEIKMSANEMTTKIEALRELEELIEEAKAGAETLRDEIKGEMMARNVEELSVGQFIVRWTSILSNRFDTTGFKRAYGDLYKAYTKQTASRRFTISV
jgi:predicted phage-related endonuclease